MKAKATTMPNNEITVEEWKAMQVKPKRGRKAKDAPPVRPEAEYLDLRLPVPPSANALFVQGINRRTGKPIRVKTAEYTTWLKDSEAALFGVKLFLVPSPLRIFFTFCGDWNESRDGSNAIKAVEDFLVSIGVITDDSLKHIVAESWEYEPSDEPAFVRVEIMHWKRKDM